MADDGDDEEDAYGVDAFETGDEALDPFRREDGSDSARCVFLSKYMLWVNVWKTLWVNGCPLWKTLLGSTCYG